MRDATFTCRDLTTFCRLDELGLEVTGQRLEPDGDGGEANSNQRIADALHRPEI